MQDSGDYKVFVEINVFLSSALTNCWILKNKIAKKAGLGFKLSL